MTTEVIRDARGIAIGYIDDPGGRPPRRLYDMKQICVGTYDRNRNATYNTKMIRIGVGDVLLRLLPAS